MKITVNGEIKFLNSESFKNTLANVMTELGYDPGKIVVEFNGLIIPSDQWEEQKVQDGDNLEIVTIVGGGS